MDETAAHVLVAGKSTAFGTAREPTLVALLAVLGAVPIAYRRVVLCAAEDRAELEAALRAVAERGGPADRAWITVEAWSDGKRGALPGHLVYLVSASQHQALEAFSTEGRVILGNEQVLGVGVGHATGSTVRWPYMLFPLLFEGLDGTIDAPEPPTFQLYPINEMAEEARRPRAAFAVILNPEYRSAYGRNTYVLLRNPDPAIRVGGRPLELPLPLTYRDQVPRSRAVVHETIVRALGMRPGELADLYPTRVRQARVENSRLMRDRRMVARVRASDDVDVGYPVCRLEERVLDVLGLRPGDELMINSRLTDKTTNAHWEGGALVPRVKVRALTDRGSAAKAHDGGLDLDSTIGGDTLPKVSLDLLRRQSVGVLPGEPVLLRPAFGSLFAGDLWIGLNALALGAGGSLIADKLYLAGACALAIVALLLADFVRRFR